MPCVALCLGPSFWANFALAGDSDEQRIDVRSAASFLDGKGGPERRDVCTAGRVQQGKGPAKQR